MLGSSMGSKADFEAVYELVAGGQAKPIVDQVFPLAEARAAHERLEEASSWGRSSCASRVAVPGEERGRAIAFMRGRDLAQVDRVAPFARGRALITESLPEVHDLNFLLADALTRRRRCAARRGSRAGHGLGRSRPPARERRRRGCGRRLARGSTRSAGAYSASSSWCTAGRRIDRPSSGRSVRSRSRPSAITPSYRPRQPFARTMISSGNWPRRTRAGRPPGWHSRSFATASPSPPVHLYFDGSVAQIESVSTLEQHRGRGYARAVVQVASSRPGSRHVLVANLDDWPQVLYRKLGFDDAGTESRS